jgi:4-amino-4-deoxy-L-arabinose transferase-like glycosyltransferase
MNPMYYGTLTFLAFMTPFFLIAAWILRGWRRDEIRKQAGFVASTPESHSRSEQ